MPKKPKKSDPAAELSVKMTQALKAQRAQGGGAYPTTIARLRELADPNASSELALEAIGKRSFSQRVIVAKKKDLSAPIALREDLEQLAASRRVLEYALQILYESGPPPWPIKKLSGKLDRALKSAFQNAVDRQVAENTLPESVAVIRVRREQALYLKRQPPPPPPPPPKPPKLELSERLVRVLEAQRRLGPESYPVRLDRLVDLTGLAPTKKLRASALKAEPFAGRAVPLVTKHPDSLVALAEDVEQAADHPSLLGHLLEIGRNDAVQAFSVAEMKSRLDKRAQTPFADSLDRRMESGALPAGVGWIGAKIGKKTDRLLFRLEDVHGGRPAAAPAREQPDYHAAAPADGADFDAAFEEAFTRLDRARGSNNFVSLVDLRKALPLDRATFDACLRRLRESHRYSLSAAEGWDGLAEEQRAAGIMEEGSLLLFVSRREP